MVMMTRSLADEVFPLAYGDKQESQRVNNLLKTAIKNVGRNGITVPLSFSDKDVDELITRKVLKKNCSVRHHSSGSSLYKVFKRVFIIGGGHY